MQKVGLIISILTMRGNSGRDSEGSSAVVESCRSLLGASITSTFDLLHSLLVNAELVLVSRLVTKETRVSHHAMLT
jgi:hypothetical protein